MKNSNGKMKIENERYISLSEAAKVYGCTQKHLNFMARLGKLKAKKIGRNWFTTIEWLQEYADKTEKINGSNGKNKSYGITETDKIGVNLLRKNIIVPALLGIMFFAFFASAYVSLKDGVLGVPGGIKNAVAEFSISNTQDSYRLQAQAIIETNKALKEVFRVDDPNTKAFYFAKNIEENTNDLIGNNIKSVVYELKILDRKINRFFNSVFASIDKAITRSGRFVIKLVYTFIDALLNSPERFASNLKKMFFAMYDFTSSLSVTNLFPNSFDMSDSNQTLVSIRDLYQKLKITREFVEGRTIFVNRDTQHIVYETTVVKTIQKETTLIKDQDLLNAQFANLKQEIFNQIAKDVTDFQSKIGSQIITQNNYYYSEATKVGRIQSFGEDITFNENIYAKKNIVVTNDVTINNDLTVLGGVVFDGTVSISDTLTLDDITVNNLLTFANAIGTSLDVTSSSLDTINTITLTDGVATLTQGNFIGLDTISTIHASISDDLTVSDVFTVRDGIVSISDDFYFGDDVLWSSIANDYLYSSSSWNIFGNLDVDGIVSISESLIVPTLTATNFSAMHVSISDDLTIGDNITFSDTVASISGNFNLDGDLTGVRASMSDSLTVADILHTSIFTDGTSMLFGGSFTGLNNLTSTNIFSTNLSTTHASVSDDLTVGINTVFRDGYINSAGVLSINTGNNQPINLGTGLFSFTNASASEGIETSELKVTTIGSDAVLTINAFTLGGNITGNNQNISGINSLTATTGLFTHASVSDDFETLSAQITSASIGTLYAGATTLSGNLDMSNNLILNIGNAGTDFTTGGGLNLAGVLTTPHASVSDDLTVGINTAFRDGYINSAGTLSINTGNNQPINLGTGLFSFTNASSSEGIETSELKVTTIGSDTTLTINAFTLGGNITGNNKDITGINSLTATTGLFTHASISDDFETLSAQITSASIGTLYAGATTLSGNLDMANNLILNIGNSATDFTTGGGLNLAGALTTPHASVSDDLTVGINTVFRDGYINSAGTLSINTGNNQPINLGTGLFSFTNASASEGIETSELKVTTIGSDAVLTINAFTLGGNITGNNQNISGINSLTATTGLFTHASVSNDFETLSAQITSASIGTLYAGATTLSGNLDMSNNLVLNIGNAGTDFTTGGGLNLAGALNLDNTASISGDIAGYSNLTISGTITSGLINGQTISSAANFTGTVTAATSFLS
ncbi:MAG: hypothetical protein V1686_01395, partial [Patescibacteria group bacterium]